MIRWTYIVFIWNFDIKQYADYFKGLPKLHNKQRFGTHKSLFIRRWPPILAIYVCSKNLTTSNHLLKIISNRKWRSEENALLTIYKAIYYKFHIGIRLWCFWFCNTKDSYHHSLSRVYIVALVMFRASFIAVKRRWIWTKNTSPLVISL